MTIWLLSSNGHHGILLFDPKLLHGRSCPDKRWHGLSSDVPGLLLSTHGWISRRNWPWSLDYHLLGTFPQLKPQIHICTNPPMTCFENCHPYLEHMDIQDVTIEMNLMAIFEKHHLNLSGHHTRHSHLTLFSTHSHLYVHCTSYKLDVSPLKHLAIMLIICGCQTWMKWPGMPGTVITFPVRGAGVVILTLFQPQTPIFGFH